MKKMLLCTLVLCSSMAFAQTQSGLDKCAYDLSKQILTIVKQTVGLHNEEQVKGAVDMVKMVCIERQGLAAKEGLSQQDAMKVISEAVKRSLVEVFDQQALYSRQEM